MLLLLSVGFASCSDSDEVETYGNPPEGVTFVDLGLPSKTKWANMNVGATAPEDVGHYFAWGEITPKAIYNRSTYLWYDDAIHNYSITKYLYTYKNGVLVNDVVELEKGDDAAYMNWGKHWRMPSKKQMIELLEYTTHDEIRQNGVLGFKLTSKKNGNYIFLPAGGFYNSNMYGTQLRSPTNYQYWSRTLGGAEEDACGYGGHLSIETLMVRESGFLVRPVRI